MNRSDNQFIKNRNSQNILNRNSRNGWEGPNTTAGPLGFDDINSGDAFGIGALGGLVHFKKIVRY